MNGGLILEKQAIYDEIKKLRKEIEYHANLYYNLDAPEVSDAYYDELFKKLKNLEESYPEFNQSLSPTSRIIGQVKAGFQSFRHKVALLSLENAFTLEDLKYFEKQAMEQLEVETFSYDVEFKIDGLSVGLYYDNGKLINGATRGNGIEGEDVTSNLVVIEDIPKTLPNQLSLSLRGEVYLSKDKFEKLNNKREYEGEALFANPRNAASGTLRQLDSKVVKERELSCFIYSSLETGDIHETQTELLSYLEDIGFHVVPHFEAKSIEDAYQICKEWEKKRKDLAYEIDGMVIKVNEIRYQEILGNKTRVPRWAIAYKFQAEQKLTTLEHISLQVGRTGAITPVAHLKPVKLAGTTVSRATLHNRDFISQKDIREGDEVYIQKAGEIIPEVVGVFKADQENRQASFQFPKTCPECNTPLEENEEIVAIYCPNHRGCPAQIKGRITHFVSKQALNLDGLGAKIIEKFYDEGLISKASDLFFLEKEKLLELEGFGEKSVTKLLEVLEAGKTVSLERFLFGLGIPFVGIQTSKTIAKAYPDITKIMDLDEDALLELTDIGNKIAESVRVYFSDEENRAEIKRLISVGFKFENEQSIESSQLFGKKFVLTGKLSGFTRDEAKALIEAHGGSVATSVSKNTDFLLSGEKSGSKYEKALALGIPILSEDEFLTLIK